MELQRNTERHSKKRLCRGISIIKPTRPCLLLALLLLLISSAAWATARTHSSEVPEGLSQSQWNTMVSVIEQDRYQFQKQAPGVYTARNPA